MIAMIAYLILFVVITHVIRTWAFSRYEAVTFEFSSVMVMVSIAFVGQYGLDSIPTVLVFSLCFIMFFVNAFSQYRFYIILQDKIKKAFNSRTDFLGDKEKEEVINKNLCTMATVAIMPSFSRFIEESKFFNNPGSLIGLVKTTMKRQRFQKKKYLMRECFARNANLIGPCAPSISKENVAHGENKGFPAIIHVNDLALDYKQEKIGLFLFDLCGFGALLLMIGFVVYLQMKNETDYLVIEWNEEIWVYIFAAFLFTLISHSLRHYAFARYESFWYELTFTVLIISSSRIILSLVYEGVDQYWKWGALAFYTMVFVSLSFINKRYDKKLHTNIKKKYDEIIRMIKNDSETDRAKIEFINNLKYISEWALVPVLKNDEKIDWFYTIFNRLAFNDRLKEFEKINREKNAIPNYTEELIEKIVPECSEIVDEKDFRYDDKALRRALVFRVFLSIISFVSLFWFIKKGII